jgi:hypothetical protein
MENIDVYYEYGRCKNSLVFLLKNINHKKVRRALLDYWNKSDRPRGYSDIHTIYLLGEMNDKEALDIINELLKNRISNTNINISHVIQNIWTIKVRESIAIITWMLLLAKAKHLGIEERSGKFLSYDYHIFSDIQKKIYQLDKLISVNECGKFKGLYLDMFFELKKQLYFKVIDGTTYIPTYRNINWIMEDWTNCPESFFVTTHIKQALDQNEDGSLLALVETRGKAIIKQNQEYYSKMKILKTVDLQKVYLDMVRDIVKNYKGKDKEIFDEAMELSERICKYETSREKMLEELYKMSDGKTDNEWYITTLVQLYLKCKTKTKKSDNDVSCLKTFLVLYKKDAFYEELKTILLSKRK